MKNGSEKTASLSKEVRALIDRDPYVKNTLADGLINYSALARCLAPKIKKSLDREIKEESLIVAIKRHADEINGKTSRNDYLDLLARSTISMQDDISYALISRNRHVLEEIESMLEKTDWHQAEIRIVIDAPNRVIVVLKSPRMTTLKDKFKDDFLDFSEGNCLITMREPIESKNIYGVIAEITSRLSRKGISIELVSAPPDLHFLVNEKDAEEAYTTLRHLIKDAKRALDEGNFCE